MNSSRRERLENPIENASVLSKLFFLWMYKIIFSWNKASLEEDDIPQPMAGDRAEDLGNRLEKRWIEEIATATAKNRKPSLFRTIAKEFGLQYLSYGVLFFVQDFSSTILRPILLGRLLTFFSPSSNMTTEEAALYALLLSFTFFLSGFLMEHYFVKTQMLGVRTRIACISLVYRKCLRLNRNAFVDTSPGQIINLISNDVARFEVTALLANSMWIAPIVAAILFYMLVTSVGVAGVIGFCVLLTILPIQAYNGTLTSRFRMQMAKRTDERVRLTDEVISGIQVIKLYAWEKSFQALINAVRRKELQIVAKASFLRGVYMLFNLFTTRFALFCTLLSIVLAGGQLSVQLVFVMSSYFAQLAFTLTGLFVRGFAEIAECNVSIRRLETFLLRTEYGSPIEYTGHKPTKLFKNNKAHDMLNGVFNHNGKERYHSNYEDGFVNKAYEEEVRETRDETECMVELSGVNAQWSPQSQDLTLDNISLKVTRGQLVGVVGSVGAGKSSLLQLILGELPNSQGVVKVNGTVSYASQEPWIFAGTVKHNIVFGQEYDPRKYKRVTKVCCLERDFELLPQGDKTIVGERGISLSGGQKARINLARAVYKSADIYLLDDPLSAVDAHVGKHLFDMCIHDYLQGKTCILVTHQIQHKSQVDHLVLLKNSTIDMQGTFWQLQRSGLDYTSLADSESTAESNIENTKQFERGVSYTSTRSRTSSYGVEDLDNFDGEPIEKLKEETTHMPARELYKGYIKSGVTYFQAGFVVFTIIFTQAMVSLSDVWISHWTTMEQKRHNIPEIDEYIWPSITYCIVHGVIILSLFIVGLVRNLSFSMSVARCSEGLHKNMFTSVMGTNLSFFHDNPSGRILNRFAKDLGAIDELLPKALLDVGQSFSLIISGVLISMFVNPWFIVPTVLVTAFSGFIRNKFVKVSKNIKRIEGIARSPVYSHVNTTLQGLTTIRANKAEAQLLKEFDRYQDNHTASLFIFYYSTCAFTYILSFLSSCFITMIIVSFIFTHDNSYGAYVGLTITQTISVTLYLQWGVRMSAEISNQMTACERLLEYTKLEPEEKITDNKLKPTSSWPTQGRIEMINVNLKYGPQSPSIVQDLTVTILPKEKVGIVGRTGAGKSSLIGGLFRLMDVDGQIIIDGIDTSTLRLEDLRQKISIIPQDPTLFSGTLRRNLDPFGQFGDNQLWTVLEEIEMKDNEGISLDMKVMDGGGNFSVGQRQLICLARAILRNNKILVLDEATANVDHNTDALIQKTIRRKFAEQTVLTIAHRLNTIMDSDKVLVMDAGKLVEFDHPYTLLSNTDGFFFKLVQQTGKTMASHLIDCARDNYYKTS